MWASVCRWARRPSRWPDLVSAGWALVFCWGCNDEVEAQRVLGRIDQMRDAPIAARAEAIRALAELEPAHPGAARARRVCLDAYEKLQKAHDRAGAAKARVDALKARGETPRYEEVTAADDAIGLMLEAKKAEPGCAKAVADLRRELR